MVVIRNVTAVSLELGTVIGLYALQHALGEKTEDINQPLNNQNQMQAESFEEVLIYIYYIIAL